jgi:hypothetical protein
MEPGKNIRPLNAKTAHKPLRKRWLEAKDIYPDESFDFRKINFKLVARCCQTNFFAQYPLIL